MHRQHLSYGVERKSNDQGAAAPRSYHPQDTETRSVEPAMIRGMLPEDPIDRTRFKASSYTIVPDLDP